MKKLSLDSEALFIAEFDSALDHVAHFPHAHQIMYLEFRRVLLNRFPFAIGFRVRHDVVFVDGFFPTKANDRRIINPLNQRSN